jgi:flagellar FliJ protein
MPRRRPFRYDMLLRVRQRQEEVQAVLLASTRGEIRSAEHERADIVREQIAMLDEAGKAAEREFDASDVRRYYQYERHLARLAVEKDADLARLAAVEEDRRAELEEAMKRRRIVERLKERRQREFFAELNKEEQAASDEVATNQAAMTVTDRRKS